MATITTIDAGDNISDSRSDINTNFSNLNSDKIETSVLDTDTTLAANSDAKVATQKAVKAYVDTGGNVNASTTAKGIVEEATSAEMIAGTAAGGTGARLFLNPSLVAETGADKILKTKSTGKIDSSVQNGLTYKNGVTTRAGDAASGDQTIAHGCGAAPRKVRITARWAQQDGIVLSTGAYDGTNQSAVWAMLTGNSASGEDAGNSATVAAYLPATPAESDIQSATVAVDATNITLTWTKTGTPPGSTTIHIMWEAEV